jgi:glyceraldehyde-3-phosphate dehydrogenase (NADP+)
MKNELVINKIALNLTHLFLYQGLRDSGIGSQGITNSFLMMTKTKSTVINLPTESYTMG